MKKPTNESVQAAQKAALPPHQGTCPNCGYCPHCGRSTAPPIYPRPFPYVYPRPWYGGTSAPPPSYPTITCSASSNGTLH